MIGAALGTVTGLAWLLHRFVERPLTPRLREALTRGIGVANAAPAERRPGALLLAGRERLTGATQ